MQISSNLIIKNIDKGTISFNSDKPSVATIDSNGLLSIHGVGTATITAKRSKDSNSAIELNATLSLTVNRGDQAALVFDESFVTTGYSTNKKVVNIARGGTGNGAITYSIDNTNVATINSTNGQLTLKSIGKAIVTASKAGNANYSTISNSYELTVNNKKEQSALIFAQASITLDYKQGGVTTSNVIVSGGDGSGAITYRSDNEAIATVNNKGVVTIKGAGKTKIRATKAEDREYNPIEANYDLTVNKIAQTGFGFAQSTFTASYLTDKTVEHTATGGEGNGLITYDSNNTGVATVDKDGVVTIKGAGTAIITANKAEDTNYKATQASYALVVNKAPQTGFRFAKDVFTTAYAADKQINNIPQGGQGEGAITYKIDKTSVATIDSTNGVLTLKSIGTATVTATKDGDDNYHPISATYTLHVANLKELFMTLGIKNIKFAWGDSTGTDYYRLRSNLGHFDPAFVDASTSGFVVVPNSTNIKQTTARADIALHRYIPLVDRPQYQIDKCDDTNRCDINAVSDDTLSNANLNQLIGYIKASNTDAADFFSWSVSISDDGHTLAVGAFGEESEFKGVDSEQNNNRKSQSGAVYVFVRNSSAEWSQQAYIKASNTDRRDFFGAYMSLSGDGHNLAVSATGEDSDSRGVDGAQGNVHRNFDAGAVYVFTRSSTGTWSQQAYIKASNSGEGDEFGTSVSISDDGNTLVVGALFEDGNSTGVGGAQGAGATDSGAVYVFTRSGSTWKQQAYIKASNTGENDRFGYAVSLSGDGNTLGVGAINEDSNSIGVDSVENNNSTDTGAVYVFTRSSDTWSQQAYIKASNSGKDDEFGASVSLSADGNSLVVGAIYEDSNSTGVNGVENNSSANDSGAVYFFTRSGSTWSQKAYIKASNSGVGDEFGTSLSLSGDGNSLAVAAQFEDSNATGVSGDAPAQDKDDSKHDNSGAVYFFTRSGDIWQQQSYIKASNTGENDRFGWSLSISGDGNSLAVGARSESSDAKGVNGEQNNDDKASSGAVYLY